MKKLIFLMTVMIIPAVIFAQNSKQTITSKQPTQTKQAEPVKSTVKPPAPSVKYAKPPVSVAPAAPIAKPSGKSELSAPSKNIVKSGSVHQVKKAPVKHPIHHAVPVSKLPTKAVQKK